MSMRLRDRGCAAVERGEVVVVLHWAYFQVLGGGVVDSHHTTRNKRLPTLLKIYFSIPGPTPPTSSPNSLPWGRLLSSCSRTLATLLSLRTLCCCPSIPFFRVPLRPPVASPRVACETERPSPRPKRHRRRQRRRQRRRRRPAIDPSSRIRSLSRPTILRRQLITDSDRGDLRGVASKRAAPVIVHTSPSWQDD